MVGFEVSRDLTILTKTKSSLSTILTELLEEDNCKKEGKTGNSSLIELDADVISFRATSQVRESIKINIIASCDLKYELLEQKVIIPPPEYFS